MNAGARTHAMAVTSECTQLPSKYTEHAERAGTRAGAANATVLSIARSGRGRGERKTCTGAVELGVWAGEDSRDEEEEGVEEVEEEREGRRLRWGCEGEACACRRSVEGGVGIECVCELERDGCVWTLDVERYSGGVGGVEVARARPSHEGPTSGK